MYNYDRRGPIVISRIAKSARARPVNIADDESFERAVREATSPRMSTVKLWRDRYAGDAEAPSW